jgi:ferrous iron transport protein A
MPITLAPINTDIRIVRILTDEKTKKHLEDLGININAIIKVLSSVNGGVVVAIKNGRLALDRSIASKILVA